MHNIVQKDKGGTDMAIFKGAGVAIITPMHEDEIGRASCRERV